MPEINLLRTDSSSSTSSADYTGIAKLVSRLLGFVLLLVIVATVAVFVMNWLNGRKLQTVNDDIKTAQASALSNKDRSELITRQNQLVHLEKLIDGHLYWSYLLPEMARVTLKSARYTSIIADGDGTMTLVVNLPSYEDVEKYMQIFDLPEYNQQFSNVRIVSINPAQSDSTIVTQLTIELTFNPAYIKGRM